MEVREFIHDIIVTSAAILMFLGLQAYLKNYIDSMPWLFIGIGMILFIKAKKLSGWLG